ncbi:glycerol-3-phosphate dehydrogenase/oxidase [Sulfitobacter sp. PR48]|uniref:glycerol-3-phosphate dehydrogenase/oxidase n=1 Tax=Sulfitobacter sp. PR48 TaxID=3028383 RepID=UPI00237B5F81|nr:glycerol-3-phosphate dehydrogenase/oxidase [Sulfitobacter sp. PR48]MDD9722898.1 glycerol-3-phosphate dehydrogenase/oxidase [Sulfitobacter sp. PR48]
MSEQRKQNLAQLTRNAAFDAVVVGGGVNGIGVYRDLSLQGLRVLLIERNDFCSGCSAAPSRMIHGGLRYLENGEFDLVRESLFERDALLRNAPHMVRPLPTVIPIASWFSGTLNAAAQFLGRGGKPAARGAVPIKLGLALYDWVTRKRRVLPKHRFHSGAQTRRLWPALTDKSRRSAVYYDAWISHPERLCVELLRDVAEAAPGSIALNYAEIELNGNIFRLRDSLSGATFEISPKVVVNATGAWLDDTIAALVQGKTERLVSGTKGSHLIIDNARLYDALNGHMAYFENTDGRVCIVFPYQGKVLAGSTDIRVEKARRVRCEDDERDYILGALRLVFPQVAISADEVVFSYSGIRPLPHSDQDFTGRISRGHDIRRLPGAVPQFCMVGGKWTTFRAFAEQTADAVLSSLVRNRRVSTRDMAIGGGRQFPDDPSDLCRQLRAQYALPPNRAEQLIDRYGTRAAELAGFCQAEQDRPLVAGCTYGTAEILWICRNEFVETLSDIVLRRTALAISGQISMEIIAALAALFGRERVLPEREIKRQSDALIAELDSYHGVTSAMLVARNESRRM